MIVSKCPRCQEDFRVPAGPIPSDAQAICPWCREQFALSEVLDQLPPMLEVLGPEGTPIEIDEASAFENAPVAIDTDSPAVEEIGTWQPEDAHASDDSFAIEETPEEPATHQWRAEEDSVTSSMTFTGDADEAMRVMPVPVRRRKKGSGIRTAIGVVLGGIASIPIAGGILMLLGRTPDWGFWPFDGGVQDSGPGIVAAPLSSFGSETRRPFGQSLMEPDDIDAGTDPTESVLDSVVNSSRSKAVMDSDETSDRDVIPTPESTNPSDTGSSLQLPDDSEPLSNDDPADLAMPATPTRPESSNTASAGVTDPVGTGPSDGGFEIPTPEMTGPDFSSPDVSTAPLDQTAPTESQIASAGPEIPADLSSPPQDLNRSSTGLALPESPQDNALVAPPATIGDNPPTLETSIDVDTKVETTEPSVAAIPTPESPNPAASIPSIEEIPETLTLPRGFPQPENTAATPGTATPGTAMTGTGTPSIEEIGKPATNENAPPALTMTPAPASNPSVTANAEPKLTTERDAAIGAAEPDVAAVAEAQPNESPIPAVSADAPTSNPSDVANVTDPKAPATQSPATDSAGNTETPVAMRSAAVANSASEAEGLLQRLTGFEGTVGERRLLLRDTYLKVVETCDDASASDLAIQALAKTFAESSVLDQIDEAGLDWITYSKRKFDGVMVLGRTRAVNGRPTLLLSDGTSLSLKSDNAIPSQAKVLTLGRILDDKTIEVLAAEPIK